MHHLLDDLFALLHEIIASILTEFTDYFNRELYGAALDMLQKVSVPNGTRVSSYLRDFRVVMASTVDKGCPLASSVEMAIKQVSI